MGHVVPLVLVVVMTACAAPATTSSPTPATPGAASTPVATSSTAPAPVVPLRGQALLDRASGFPRATLFRSAIEIAAQRGQPVDGVVAIAANYDLILAKALDEEVLGLQKVAPYLQAIKARYPTKIVMDHFLFTGRNPLSAQPPVFAGHWMLLNGTTLTAGVSATETVLQVADSSVLREGEGVQLTALDASGKPDYSRVEQVKVTSVAAGRVTVQRAQFGSTASAFAAPSTRVAAHAAVQYGTGDPIWKYNFCLQAPRDPQGRRFIEALADTLAGYLRPGGPLAGLDGYQFDVKQFSASAANQGTRRVDCDNDGRPDSGFVDNVSSFGLGAVAFMKALRSLVGDDTFLVSEATGGASDRDTPFANGIENESFPDLHSWDYFSAAYQRYRYWLETARAPRLSYLQLKESTEAFTRCADQDRGTNWKYRLSLGAALLGNGYFAYIPSNPEDEPQCFYRDAVQQAPYAVLDEFRAGREDRWNYLGRPVEDARRVERPSGPNLVVGGDFEGDTDVANLIMVGTSRATMARDGTQAGKGRSSLRINVAQLDADPTEVKVRVQFAPLAMQKGREYTLRVRARADPGYARIDPAYTGIPRRVAFDLTIGGVQVPAAQGIVNSLDLMADATWREYTFSFVAPADDARAMLRVLVGTEPGDVWIDDLRLTEGGSDVFVRRFERGAVLVNASASAVAFDLAALLPGMTLRRISGIAETVVNTGATVGASVTIPARDAVVLLAGP